MSNIFNDDSKIVQLYLDRDESAIEKTIEVYGKYCFTIAENILHNREDSEECVNDTWVRTWNAIPPQIPKILKAFLAKITRNISIDKYNSRNAKKRGENNIDLAYEELEECIIGTKDVEGEVMAKHLEKDIQNFISRMKERDRDVFVRRYFFFDSTANIAKRYSMKEANVLAILSRARKKLRKYLEMEGYTV